MEPLIFVLVALTAVLVVAVLSDESEDDDDYIIYNRKDEL
jgi:hypothetical protein